MIRLNVSASVAALAVSLASVFAPIEAQNALAQATPMATSVEHTQPPAEEMVPQFVTREVVQPVPQTPEPALDTGAASTASAQSLSSLVANMPRDAALDEQLECLAGAIYFEARGEPLAGQLAVAEVVVNRAASGRFPASYCGVVTQKSQFSFVKRGRIPAAPTGSALYQRARAIAQIAHRDLWSSEAKDALYFHARHVSPGWSGRKMAARIHNHVFYR